MNRLRLDPRQQALLCRLADPEAPAPAVAELAPLPAGRLVDLCDHHAIGPAVWRKLAPLAGSLPAGWPQAVSALGDGLRIATAVTLSLEALAARLRAMLEAAGIPHRIVKGAAFAGALYPEPSDRPYTDIDIVVPPEALEAASAVMSAAGLVMTVRARPEKTVLYREQKWTLDGQPHVLVEVHTDLVHLPQLRRRVTYGFREIALADREGRMPVAGHLATAVIHGALGHKFHQLKLAVDVLQAIRRLDDASASSAIEAAERLGIAFEMAASAQLVAELFPSMADHPGLVRLRALRRVPRWIDRDTVTNAHLRDDIRSRLRRHVFRWQQLLQPARPPQ